MPAAQGSGVQLSADLRRWPQVHIKVPTGRLEQLCSTPCKTWGSVDDISSPLLAFYVRWEKVTPQFNLEMSSHTHKNNKIWF